MKPCYSGTTLMEEMRLHLVHDASLAVKVGVLLGV
jgi:hypothetical protein